MANIPIYKSQTTPWAGQTPTAGPSIASGMQINPQRPDQGIRAAMHTNKAGLDASNALIQAQRAVHDLGNSTMDLGVKILDHTQSSKRMNNLLAAKQEMAKLKQEIYASNDFVGAEQKFAQGSLKIVEKYKDGLVGEWQARYQNEAGAHSIEHQADLQKWGLEGSRKEELTSLDSYIQDAYTDYSMAPDNKKPGIEENIIREINHAVGSGALTPAGGAKTIQETKRGLQSINLNSMIAKKPEGYLELFKTPEKLEANFPLLTHQDFVTAKENAQKIITKRDAEEQKTAAENFLKAYQGKWATALDKLALARDGKKVDDPLINQMDIPTIATLHTQISSWKKENEETEKKAVLGNITKMITAPDKDKGIDYVGIAAQIRANAKILGPKATLTLLNDIEKGLTTTPTDVIAKVERKINEGAPPPSYDNLIEIGVKPDKITALFEKAQTIYAERTKSGTTGGDAMTRALKEAAAVFKYKQNGGNSVEIEQEYNNFHSVLEAYRKEAGLSLNDPNILEIGRKLYAVSEDNWGKDRRVYQEIYDAPASQKHKLADRYLDQNNTDLTQVKADFNSEMKAMKDYNLPDTTTGQWLAQRIVEQGESAASPSPINRSAVMGTLHPLAEQNQDQIFLADSIQYQKQKNRQETKLAPLKHIEDQLNRGLPSHLRELATQQGPIQVTFAIEYLEKQKMPITPGDIKQAIERLKSEDPDFFKFLEARP